MGPLISARIWSRVAACPVGELCESGRTRVPGRRCQRCNRRAQTIAASPPYPCCNAAPVRLASARTQSAGHRLFQGLRRPLGTVSRRSSSNHGMRFREYRLRRPGFGATADDLLAKVFAGNGARAIHRAEYMDFAGAGSGVPSIDCDFHPRRHRRGPNAAILSDEIDDTPTPVVLLPFPTFSREPEKLRPTALSSGSGALPQAPGTH
jgi:hypothetical protein